MLELLIDIPLSVVVYVGMVFGFRFLHPLHDVTPSFNPTAASPSAMPQEATLLAASKAQATPELTPLPAEPAFSETAGNDRLLGQHVPKEDVLQRHFLQFLAMVFETLYPRPQESVQRRHQLQFVGRELLDVLASASAYEALIDRYESLQHPAMLDLDLVEGSLTDAIEPPLVALTPLLELPQDSVLRRHVLHRLASEVEALFPRPTDSVLRRHYDQWLHSEWNECLNA